MSVRQFDRGIALEGPRHRLVFTADRPGEAMYVRTEVRTPQGTWSGVLDGIGNMLVAGPLFDIAPQRWDVLEDSTARSAVRFSGRKAGVHRPTWRATQYGDE